MGGRFALAKAEKLGRTKNAQSRQESPNIAIFVYA
jgi:hypothetical protein